MIDNWIHIYNAATNRESTIDARKVIAIDKTVDATRIVIVFEGGYEIVTLGDYAEILDRIDHAKGISGS